MKKLSITPGNIAVADRAIYFFGPHRVEYTIFMPLCVKVKNLSDGEVVFAKNNFENSGQKVEVIADITILPGSMGVAGRAIDLFGMERVDVGTWTTPVRVNDLSEAEIAFAEEFFKECGQAIEVIKE